MPAKKKTSKSAAPLASRKPAAGTATATPPPGNAALPTVRVRMYRQGLGDCLLITFNPGPAQANVLIDFGTLGSSAKLASMPDVMANIEAETKLGNGSSHLHLLIATHEHQDHLSGFRTFDERFKKFQVDHVWLAWTEDQNDPLTKKLGKSQDIALALAASAQALLAHKDVDSRAYSLGQTMEGLLGFVGEFGADKFAPTVDEAMDFVRDTFAPPRFLKPGDPPIEEPWLPGFRFYILGPPHDENAIRDMGENGDPRLYGLRGVAAGAAMRMDNVTDPQASEAELPFDLRFRRREGDPVMAPVIGSYLSADATWRRVDSDWLYNAAEFALQFDKFINNTSLALAIERIADGKVLVFPGDAQAGNWQSWQKHAWNVKQPDGSMQTVAARQLLNRTVFYKAGHHASHNGTPKKDGLEQMIDSDELVTFIPVDRPKALNHNPPWKMPAQKLYSQLIASCSGRVVRSDIGWVVDPATQAGVERDLAPIGTADLWKTWKANQAAAPVQIHPKWIDFNLE
jgi:hypothetical protein